MHSAQIDYDHRHAPARTHWRPGPRLLVWLLFLIGCAAVTFAGLASLPGCSSSPEATATLEAASRWVAQLKDQEAAAAAKGDTQAAAAAATKRASIEAAAAAVAGAQAAQAAPEETAAGAAVAGLVGGPAAAAITAGVALVGHLWRTSRLRDALANLNREMEDQNASTADIVHSIENAKDADPRFAAAFEQAAPIIRARQTGQARKVVDRIAGDRQRSRRVRQFHEPAAAPVSSAPAASA